MLINEGLGIPWFLIQIAAGPPRAEIQAEYNVAGAF